MRAVASQVLHTRRNERRSSIDYAPRAVISIKGRIPSMERFPSLFVVCHSPIVLQLPGKFFCAVRLKGFHLLPRFVRASENSLLAG